MSTIISIKSEVSSIGSPNIVQTFSAPFRFRTPCQIHVVRASISKYIANIYDATDAGLDASLSNNAFKITRSDGVNPDESKIIALETGIYDISLINLAIIDAFVVAGWAISRDENHPLTFSYNAATQKIFMTINDTHMGAPYNLTVDFTDYPLFKALLGFTQDTYTDTEADADGTIHIAEESAKLDWTGNNIDVSITGFGALSWRYGQRSNVICTIPLGTADSSNEYSITGETQPFIRCMPDTQITTISVEYKGSRRDDNKNRILLLEGQAEITIEVRE